MKSQCSSVGSCCSWRSPLLAFHSLWLTSAPVIAPVNLISWFVRGIGVMYIAYRVYMTGASDTVKGEEM